MGTLTTGSCSFCFVSASIHILVATDNDTTFEEVDAALGDANTSLTHLRAGAQVRPMVSSGAPDLVVCDLQIGSMGGVAISLDLRAEEGAGRLPRVPILLLCDREADRFIAERSGADAWLFKPLEALELRTATDQLLAGALQR